MERERGRGREGEGEVLCCWIIYLAIEPAAVWGWISAATDVCGVKIARVGGVLEGGMQGDEGYGDRESGREVEMDHPVLWCTTGKKGGRRKLEICRLFEIITSSKKLTTRKFLRRTIWLKPLRCYSGGHHSAYRCITVVTFASADQWDPARLDSIGATSTAVAPDCSPVVTPSAQQLWKAQLGSNLLLPSQLSVTPAWLHDVLQTLLAGVGRMKVWESGGARDWWSEDRSSLCGVCSDQGWENMMHLAQFKTLYMWANFWNAVFIAVKMSFKTLCECCNLKNTLHVLS